MSGLNSVDILVDASYPLAPIELYKLMFDSEWFERFLIENQQVRDLKFEEWKEREPGSSLLERDFQYTKTVSGPGPKEVVCLEHEENQHRDEDDYIETQTTTHTPGVPYGSAFLVVTTTRIAWAENRDVGSVVNVSVEVIWTGWCPFKSMVEGRVIAGQREYSSDLDSAIQRELAAEGNYHIRSVSETARAHFIAPAPHDVEKQILDWRSAGDAWLERQSPVPVEVGRSLLWRLIYSLFISLLLGLIFFRLYV